MNIKEAKKTEALQFLRKYKLRVLIDLFVHQWESTQEAQDVVVLVNGAFFLQLLGLQDKIDPAQQVEERNEGEQGVTQPSILHLHQNLGVDEGTDWSEETDDENEDPVNIDFRLVELGHFET